MNQNGFERYLKETKKAVIKRRKVKLPKPNDALLYIEQELSEKWTWGVLPHNCVTFVEGIIKAGGGDWSSWTNCPALAKQDQQHRLNLAALA
jgi:hypothetical protein